jgi:PAS domain-containing protein
LYPKKPPELLLAYLSILKETQARVYSMAQKQASQHVPNSNERKGIDAAIIQLASIVESSGDAIFGETLQAVITSWNSSAEKLFGYSASDGTGARVAPLCHHA